MTLSRILSASAFAIFSAGMSSAAVVGVDLSLLSDGSVSDPTVISAGGVDVTFSNPQGDGLQVASGLAGLTSKGICANDIALGIFVNECQGELQIDFSTGVDDLAFTIDGISLISSTTLEIDYAGGSETYSETDLLSLSLFGANIINGVFDLSGFSEITRVLVDYDSIASVNEAYLGDMSFTTAVPVPFSLPLAASGIGLLGLMRLRRSTTSL